MVKGHILLFFANIQSYSSFNPFQEGFDRALVFKARFGRWPFFGGGRRSNSPTGCTQRLDLWCHSLRYCWFRDCFYRKGRKCAHQLDWWYIELCFRSCKPHWTSHLDLGASPCLSLGRVSPSGSHHTSPSVIHASEVHLSRPTESEVIQRCTIVVPSTPIIFWLYHFGSPPDLAVLAIIGMPTPYVRPSFCG